jgi:hypothetical protein
MQAIPTPKRRAKERGGRGRVRHLASQPQDNVTASLLRCRNRGTRLDLIVGEQAPEGRASGSGVREKAMPKQGISLRNIAIAAITAAALSLPMLAVAQANQQAEATPAARMHLKKQKHPSVARKEFYDAAPSTIPGCTWPYINMAPPCMSTWPAGDPNYHGPRPGP